VNVDVNGEHRIFPPGLTLAQMLAELGFQAPSGIAIAVNATVVTRAAFATHALCEGDRIEIIRAVAGG
jgi:sulfur carrier protein